MDRCLIVFDLDTKLLEQHYHNASWRNAYADIQRILYRHRFTNIQGTVYLSERGVRQAHGTLALQELAIRLEWFDKCVSNVQFYDLADDFNAQFIIDGVSRAREAFAQRLNVLRAQLVDAGLAQAQIEDILGKQQFSLENVTQGALPDTSE